MSQTRYSHRSPFVTPYANRYATGTLYPVWLLGFRIDRVDHLTTLQTAAAAGTVDYLTPPIDAQLVLVLRAWPDYRLPRVVLSPDVLRFLKHEWPVDLHSNLQ